MVQGLVVGRVVEESAIQEASAKALLGMRPGSDDGLEKGSGRGTNPLAGRNQASRRSLAVAAMGARHVIGNRRVAAPVERTGMLAIRCPLWKISTLLSAMRTSRSSRMSRYGVEYQWPSIST